MSLMDRRAEYSWPRTSIADLSVIPDKTVVSLRDSVGVSVGFRVIGGLRESFMPDVWTLAWEDNDKMVRLTMDVSISAGGSSKQLGSTGKQVRRARFYWSRDPDLPYRIWTAVVHEDGGAPIIPSSVDDARSKFLDVVKRFEFPAKVLGKGVHRLSGDVAISWNRRSYIEKGDARGRTKPVELKVES